MLQRAVQPNLLQRAVQPNLLQRAVQPNLLLCRLTCCSAASQTVIPLTITTSVTSMLLTKGCLSSCLVLVVACTTNTKLAWTALGYEACDMTS